MFAKMFQYKQLSRLEKIICCASKTPLTLVGKALHQIQAEKMYVAVGFNTFIAYLGAKREAFGFDHKHAYYLVAAYQRTCTPKASTGFCATTSVSGVSHRRRCVFCTMHTW